MLKKVLIPVFFLVLLQLVLMPQMAAAQGIKISRDLEFAKIGDRSMLLDLYVPEGNDGPYPLIIWVYGGSWQSAQPPRKDCPPHMIGLTEEGYAAASISYRFSHEAPFPAQIEDCKAAVRWLRAHAEEYNLDPDHFGAMGASAGGHLVALLGTTADIKEFDVGDHLDQSSAVQAVCDYCGPTAFFVPAGKIPGMEGREEAIEGFLNNPQSPVAKLLGGTPYEKPELAKKASPLFHVTEKSVPFLIVHGARDTLVPLQQSELFYDALRRCGVDSHIFLVPNCDHVDMKMASPDYVKEILGFFDKYLKD